MLRALTDILDARDAGFAPKGWSLAVSMREECIGYAAWNDSTREALIVDPRLDAVDDLLALREKLADCLWLAVVDTHTHADHLSGAPRLAEKLGAPLVMHERAPSRRVGLRVGAHTTLAARAGAVRLIPTPGHTPDGLCVLWGPFLFTGDTILFADTGRDDLPGGDPVAHYESLVTLRGLVPPEAIVLPGHDPKGGRASSWKLQLELNASLTQERNAFVREAGEFRGPSPQLLKESLFENMR